MSNLVENFIKCTTACDEPHRVIMHELNKELNTQYKLNRLYEWRKGTRAVPDPVRVYMLECSLHYIFRQFNIVCPDADQAFYESIVESLMPTIR